jgi:hypothetical protein
MVMFAFGTAMFAFGMATFAFGMAMFAFGMAMFAFGMAMFAFGMAMFAPVPSPPTLEWNEAPQSRGASFLSQRVPAPGPAWRVS